jgi:hypothetical protein
VSLCCLSTIGDPLKLDRKQINFLEKTVWCLMRARPVKQASHSVRAMDLVVKKKRM